MRRRRDRRRLEAPNTARRLRHLRALSLSPLLPVLLLLLYAPGGAEAFVVSGVVTGPGGAGVADVDLDAHDLVNDVPVVTTDDDTDAEGRFSVELPAGVYRLTFEPPPGLPVAGTILPAVEVNGDLHLEVRLARGVALAGQVTGEDGLGIAGVDVDVRDPESGAEIPTPGDDTNPLGFFGVVVPPGVYEVSFEPPVGSRLVAARLDTVAVIANRVLRVTLVAGIVVSGRVAAPGGVPVPGVDIDLTDVTSGSDLPLANDRTDTDGRFVVVALPARYDLSLEAPAPTHLVSQVVRGLLLENDIERSWELEPGVLVQGTVTDSTGMPVARTNLDFQLLPGRVTIPTPSDFTNVLGRYTVVVPPGRYDVIAVPPGEPAVPDTTAGIDIGADLVLDIRLGPDAAPPQPEPVPRAPLLGPPYPNPTSGPATIPLRVEPEAGPVRLRLIDVQGRLVRVLLDGDIVTPGIDVRWDGRNENGAPAATGIYFIDLEQRGRHASQKLFLLRPAP